jgi:hypothetical protein
LFTLTVPLLSAGRNALRITANGRSQIAEMVVDSIDSMGDHAPYEAEIGFARASA